MIMETDKICRLSQQAGDPGELTGQISLQPMDCNPPGSPIHGILRQEYWSGLPFPSPGDPANPLIRPTCLTSPALAGGFLTTEPPRKPQQNWITTCIIMKIPHTHYIQNLIQNRSSQCGKIRCQLEGKKTIKIQT